MPYPSPELKRLYRQRPEVRAREKERKRRQRATPAYKAWKAQYARACYYRDLEASRAQRRASYYRTRDRAGSPSPEAITARSANQAARQRGVPGVLTAEDVRALWERQPVCLNCGRGRGLDHIRAMVGGGSNTPENIQNLCLVCNQVKNKWDLLPGSIERPPFDGDAEQCRRGHLRATNTYVVPKTGVRMCRICMAASQRRYAARKRQVAA